MTTDLERRNANERQFPFVVYNPDLEIHHLSQILDLQMHERRSDSQPTLLRSPRNVCPSTIRRLEMQNATTQIPPLHSPPLSLDIVSL